MSKRSKIIENILEKNHREYIDDADAADVGAGCFDGGRVLHVGAGTWEGVLCVQRLCHCHHQQTNPQQTYFG